MGGADDGRETCLRDGTPLSALFDADERTVSLRLLNDRDVHQLELDRVFARTWLFIGHESEIPEPGDFVARHMGEDPVILTRGQDGTPHVMLNVCTHRGMTVCRSDTGNTATFKCPYHGWVFGTDGRMLGAPFERDFYRGGLDKSSLGLRKARTETHAGLVFATWDHNGPSLADHLGDLAWYLELMLARTDAGLEIVGSPQRFIVDSNWKLAGEQWSGDSYHTMTTHKSIEDLGFFKFTSLLQGIHVSSNGNGLIGIGEIQAAVNDTDTTVATDDATANLSANLELLRKMPPGGMTAELVDQLPNHLTPQQIQTLVTTPLMIAGIFPNMLVWTDRGFDSDGNIAAIQRIHVAQPKGPGSFEFCSWVLTERGAPEELKTSIRRASTFAGGISGWIEQDDADMWQAIQHNARGHQARHGHLRYNTLSQPSRPPGWQGPGTTYSPYMRDENQWNWWLRYHHTLTQPVTPPVQGDK
ncbi:aromatic ring-hydroxylating oxygenase subunit alpha [Streptomyces acidicola]|uniref:aromatic ring-hydroxylating oxygenase subunit alpha n=1 Tax=Streptomyces acidicola TaxID=2596892 RepID=UPI0037F708C8